MRYRSLSRTFQAIIAAALPLSGTAALSCSSSSSDTTDAPDAAPTNDAAPDATRSGDGGDAGSTDAGACADGETLRTSCGTVVSVCDNPGLSCTSGATRLPTCFPLDAAAWPDDGGGPSCDSVCGSADNGEPDGSDWQSCGPLAGDAGLMVQCNPRPCVGRRPQGLAQPPSPRTLSLGAYLAEAAHLEAASVDAFRHLGRELLAHRAPRRLVRAAERAARDEVRHARVTTALARRHGGVPVTPTVAPLAIRSLEEMAIENAAEGCVYEAFGALVGTWQAANAEDPVIRAAMKCIARDETRHAALALAIDAWAQGRLGPEARRRVRTARRDAFAVIAKSTADVPPSVRKPLGLPPVDRIRALADALATATTEQRLRGRVSVSS